MVDARRRPKGRFFCGLGTLLLVWWGLTQATPGRAADGGVATTRISDTVYRADGTPASGTVLISWPAFTTADAKPVAAGTKSVELGAGGELAVDLVPNAGATPAGALYTVVFQIDVVRTEYWLVGTTSPTTIAAVRATPGSGVAVPPVSKQYVDNAIAVNKAYVDSAVAAVGAGSYVAKNGDTMTGPLSLPADPVASAQAATKHYVDTGLAGKASLVGGVVPTAQLGAGSANNTTCLLGNSTWGPCGTSANATALQGIPLDTTAPSDGQVVTYDAASGKYRPKPGTGGATPGMLAVKYSTDFIWTQSPSTDLSAPGAKTVTLASCPAGVKGTDLIYSGGPTANPFYYVYIAGTGTPEAVLVTGGTCAGDGNPGTLTFTTVNGHAAGYTISTATAGIQEASIAAKLDIQSGAGAHYYQDGYVRVSPGTHDLRAPLTIVANHQTIDFSGAVVRCNFDAVYCIGVGRSDNYGASSNVTLIRPRAIPTVTGSTMSMIAVFGQKTRIFNAMPMIGPPNNGGYGTWGHFVTVVADQAFLLDGLDTTSGSSLVCTASFCGSAVYAPGPFSGHGTWGSGSAGDNAAVGWLKNMQIAPFCTGNGVDWQSGNVVHIEDSVIQGYAQFGVRWSMAGGGYGMATLDNVYEEGGCSSNPLGNVGYAGLIVQGGRVSIHGGEMPYGVYPTFANQPGGTPTYYYVVATDGVNGSSNLLYAGYAILNGSGNVTVTIPDIPSAVSFDLLKTTTLYQAPYGTGNWAVATGVTRASACANGVCTFTDTQAAPTSYSVWAYAPGYYPKLDYWPGPMVIGPYAAGNSAAANGTVSLDFNNLNWTAIWQTNTGGSLLDMVDSTRCILLAGSPIWEACTGQDQDLAATLMRTKTGPWTGLKGRVNLMSGSSAPSHFITLYDSNVAKTLGSALYRPTSDAADTYIGYDQGTNGAASIGLSFGAPVSISNYINNVGDGTNWKERLTASLKSFTVPVDAPGYKISGSYGTNGQCLKSTGTGSAWGSCGTGSGVTSPLTAKGDLWGFGTADARVPVGADGQCLVADSTNAVGVKWGACGTGAGAALDSAVVHNTGTETVGGDKTFTGNATFSGNVTVQGAMTVAGAWQVESAGPATPMTAGAGDSKVGFDVDGKLKVSENGGAVAEVAKVNQIPLLQTNGVSNSSQAALNLVAGTNVSLTAGANGAVTVATTALGQGPLYETDANTVEQRNGTSAQVHNLYGSYTDASNWERLRMQEVPADGYFELLTEKAGTGTQRGLCFGGTGSGCNWAVDVLGTLKPFSDNAKDIGGVTLRPRDVYVGRNLVMYSTASRYNGVATAGIGLEPVYATVSATGQTAAIASANLCGSASCGAGQYAITYYLDSTASCANAGTAKVSLNIGWTDEAGTKTYVSVPLAGNGVTGNAMNLGDTTSFGSGQISVWTTGTNAITYYTSYTGCTTGTGTYSVRIAVKQMQ
jgi:hypothetical protein